MSVMAWIAWCRESGVDPDRIIHGIHRFQVAYPEYHDRQPATYRGRDIWHSLHYDGTPGKPECHIYALAYFRDGSRYLGAIAAAESEAEAADRACERLREKIDATTIGHLAIPPLSVSTLGQFPDSSPRLELPAPEE